MKIENLHYIVIAFVVGFALGFLVLGIFSEDNAPLFKALTPTGNFVITGGSTTSTGEQNASNPYNGAIKGYIAFTIIDPETNETVSSERGSNYVLYLAIDQYNLSDFGLIKNDLSSYNGALDNIDADGNGTICQIDSYTTDNYYYDLDDNDVFNDTSGDFSVYTITTDEDGCFGSLLPIGNYTIWG